MDLLKSAAYSALQYRLQRRLKKGGTQYSYQPLQNDQKAFRTLLVFPGPLSEVVRCKLVPASLEAHALPTYETISYCWGDAKRRSVIELENVLSDVPASAADVLRRVRHTEKSRTVWIDAVCINQQDLAERSQQVAMMGEIYRHGLRNLIWIGNDRLATFATERGNSAGNCGWVFKEARKCIATLLDDMRTTTDNYQKQLEVLYDDVGLWSPSDQVSAPFAAALFTDGSELEATKQLFQGPWFHRAWVVQEAVLAKQNIVYYGSWEMDFRDMLRAATWMCHKKDYLPFAVNVADASGLRHAAQMWAIIESNAAQRDYFQDIILRFGNRLAADPRDLIYGLLGLSRASLDFCGLPELLRPDYEKPLCQVYRDAAIYMIQESQSLGILQDVALNSPDIDANFPSWVPRWHRGNGRAEGGALRFTTAWFDARADEPHHFQPGTSPDMLVVRGLQLGMIDRVSAPLCVHDGYHGTRETLQVIRAARGAVGVDEQSVGVEDDDGELGLATTLIAGTTHDQRPSANTSLRAFRAYTKYLETHKDPPRSILALRDLQKSQKALRDEDILVPEYARAFENASTNRRLFATRNGLLGLGPQTMRSTDVAVVLCGGRTPFILRAHGQQYRLIGTAYVHTVMFGEAMQWHRSSGEQDDVFELL